MLKNIFAFQKSVRDANKKLSDTIVMGKSKTGAVVIKMNGKYDVLDVMVKDASNIEKDVMGAFTDAKRSADKAANEIMKAATRGMPLPDLK